MKLSEAIRLGAMVKPQHFGALYGTRDRRRWWHRWFGWPAPKPEEGSCALGAAFEAQAPVVTRIPVSQASPLRGQGAILADADGMVTAMALADEWPVTAHEMRCPVLVCRRKDIVSRLIPHLNDDHRWPREAIAAWVAVLEARQPNPILDEPMTENVAELVSR